MLAYLKRSPEGGKVLIKGTNRMLLNVAYQSGEALVVPFDNWSKLLGN
jgi:hypothetical protein